MPLSNLVSLFKTSKPHPFVGRRIKCIEMKDNDDVVIPSGTIGTIRHVGGGVMNVKWDNGRDIGIIEDFDRYEFVD
jgi:gentisate 1,2-dioxygenase